MFGIDFTGIGSIKYEYIEDVNYLKNHADVRIFTEMAKNKSKKDIKCSVEDRKGKELTFSTLIIEPKNKIFKKLIIGAKSDNKEFKKDYIKMELSVAEEEKHNLKPLSLLEYRILLEKIRLYVLEEYKMALTFKESTFTSLEINKTIKLELPVKEYKHILQLIGDLSPKRYEQALYRNQNKLVTGIVLYNNSMEYKMYNKTEQLEEIYKIKIEGNYLRIEISLLNSKKIKSVFGTTKIYEITEEQLKEYYIKAVEKDLFKPILKYIKQSNKELLVLAQKEQDKDIKKWVSGFFLNSYKLKYDVKKYVCEKCEADIDLLFDSQQCLDIIKKKTKKNYARAYRNIKEDYEIDNIKKNNLAKLNEIIDKMFNCD